jgi:hypothetical protein
MHRYFIVTVYRFLFEGGKCSAVTIHPYDGQIAVLTTMHGKEEAIAAPFRQILGVQLIVPEGLNTDTLGTFSREVEREHSALDTLRLKVKMGLEMTGEKLGVGTEASFGPDPMIPFIARHHEMMLWRDDLNGIEVVEQMSTHQTNYEQVTLDRVDESLTDFLHRVQFPSHKVIVMPNVADEPGLIFKGISDLMALESQIRRCIQHSKDGQALVQTDMRAMMNPTRMRVISELAERLAKRLLRRCDQCASPGWGYVDVQRGLPCEQCGRPTQLISSTIEGCPSCDHQLLVAREDGLQFASAAHCNWCNP